MIVAQSLSFQQLVQVSFHETLDNVNIFHLVYGRRSDNVADVDNLPVNASLQTVRDTFIIR